jgi:hypothetical protein
MISTRSSTHSRNYDTCSVYLLVWNNIIWLEKEAGTAPVGLLEADELNHS